MFEWPKNKFSENYFSLIESARSNPPSGYSEVHHILPRSLGGDNSDTNLVRLSGSQHYHAHYWLMCMFEHGSKEWTSMSYAFNMMNIGASHQFRPENAILYEVGKSNAALATSRRNKGRPLSGEHCKALSIALTGKRHSEERRLKNSLVHRGVKQSDERRQSQSIRMKGTRIEGLTMSGKNHSNETKAQMSKSAEKFVYTLTGPMGQEFKTTNLKSFCEENKLGRGRIAKGLKSKGFQLISKQTL